MTKFRVSIFYVRVCVCFNIHFGGSEHHYRGRLNKRQQTAAAAAPSSAPINANLLHLRICTGTDTQNIAARRTENMFSLISRILDVEPSNLQT